MKKPKTTPEPYPAAPRHLSPYAQEAWNRLGPFHAATLGRQMLLQKSLESWDRAEQARERIAVEGLTTTTGKSGCIHIHPLTKVEIENRRQFETFFSKLGITIERNDPFL